MQHQYPPNLPCRSAVGVAQVQVAFVAVCHVILQSPLRANCCPHGVWNQARTHTAAAVPSSPHIEQLALLKQCRLQPVLCLPPVPEQQQ